MRELTTISVPWGQRDDNVSFTAIADVLESDSAKFEKPPARLYVLGQTPKSVYPRQIVGNVSWW